MKYNLLRLGLVIVLVFSLMITVFGQQSSGTQAVAFQTGWDAIDSLYKIEQYKMGGDTARKLLLHVAPSDYEKISRCNYLIGVSFRYTGRYDSALHYYAIAFDYGKRANDSNRVVKAGAALLSMYNHTLNNIALREKTFKELQVIYKKKLPLQLKTILLDAFADYYDISGQKGLYIETLIESVKIRQEKIRLNAKTNGASDTSNLGISFMNIAEAYLDINQVEKAREYLALARPWIVHYNEGLGHFYKNMANVYLHINKVSVADIYNDSILKLQAKSGEDLSMLIIVSNLIFVKYYLNKNDARKAAVYYEQARKHSDANTDRITLSLLHWTAALLLEKENRFKEALGYLKPLEQEAKNWPMEEYASFLKANADCYFNTGDYLKANEFYREYTVLEDSIINQIYRRNTLETEAKYQDEAKKAKIAQQQKNITLAHKYNAILIIAFCMVSVMSILLFRLYQNKKNLLNLLQENQDKLATLNSELDDSNRTKSKLLGILSHDLRSPISQVHQLLELQYSKTLNEISKEERAKLELETKMATTHLLDTMDDLLVWSKTQMQSIHPFIKSVDVNELYRQCVLLLHRQIQNKQISMEAAIPPVCMVKTDPHFLSTILRNLLHNAIKASESGGVISIVCKGDDDSHEAGSIIITNRGMAFTQQNYLDALENGETSHLLIGGLGLMVVEELCRKANIEIAFNNDDEHHTACRLLFHMSAKS